MSALVNRQCTRNSKSLSTSGEIAGIWLCVRLARSPGYIAKTTHSLVYGGACVAEALLPRRNSGCRLGTEKGGDRCVTRLYHERHGTQ